MEDTKDYGKIEIEQKTLKYLNTTRKWTMFFAVIGFIFLGLIIIAGALTGTFFSVFKPGEIGSGLPGWIIIIAFAVVALLYFFPVFFLFRFSKHTANAVHTFSKDELHKAFRNLKSYFVYLGVLLIIVLLFYLIALVIAGTSMSFLKTPL